VPRRTCEYTTVEHEDGKSFERVCEAPAADFIESVHYCAYHYDLIMRAKAAVKRIQQMFKAEYGY
jgi:hypothetical protein